MKWSTEKVDVCAGRRASRHVLKNRPGPRGEAGNVQTPFEAWNLFITPIILGKVVNYTNNTIKEFRERFSGIIDESDKYTHCEETDLMEIHAFLGLL